MNRYTSSGGTTPLKKIPSVTQTSLLVRKGSLFGPLSRTPPQHPVHGPFDLVGYSCWLQKGLHNSSGILKCRSSKHSFYSQTHPIIIYFKDAKMFRCNYYTNMSGTCNNEYIRLKNM
jgi:hypothetical protein